MRHWLVGDAVDDVDAIHRIVTEGQLLPEFQVAQLLTRIAVDHDGEVVLQIELFRVARRFRLHHPVARVHRRQLAGEDGFRLGNLARDRLGLRQFLSGGKQWLAIVLHSPIAQDDTAENG